MSRGNGDGLVEVVALEDVEPGDPLLGFGERPVGDEHLPVAESHRGRVADRAKAVTGDALPPALDVGQPLVDGQLVLWFGFGSRVRVGDDEHHVFHGVSYSWLGAPVEDTTVGVTADPTGVRTDFLRI